MFNSIQEALADLKSGKCIIVVDDEDRENEGDLVALADRVTPEIINFMITHGKGLVCVPLTVGRAKELFLKPMVIQNTDHNQTAFTVSIDSIECTTGISAFERALTVRNITKTEKTASDFCRPGHVFPLVAVEGGVLKRAGHTEATVDLARMCNAFPAGVICEIINNDGTMARLLDLKEFANKFSLKMISIEDIIDYRIKNERLLTREVETFLVTKYGR
ncbi:MAG: 3,4-dihydroxy-2-butanone-4-phosphate synthase, partial [Candidatus Hodarchaeales archaeon]